MLQDIATSALSLYENYDSADPDQQLINVFALADAIGARLAASWDLTTMTAPVNLVSSSSGSVITVECVATADLENHIVVSSVGDIELTYTEPYTGSAGPADPVCVRIFRGFQAEITNFVVPAFFPRFFFQFDLYDAAAAAPHLVSVLGSPTPFGITFGLTDGIDDLVGDDQVVLSRLVTPGIYGVQSNPTLCDGSTCTTTLDMTGNYNVAYPSCAGTGIYDVGADACACDHGYIPSGFNAHQCLAGHPFQCYNEAPSNTTFTVVSADALASTLSVTIKADGIRDNARVKEIRFGLGNNICEYPGNAWTKTGGVFGDCLDTYSFQLPLLLLTACGATGQRVDSPSGGSGKRTLAAAPIEPIEWYEYTVTMTVVEEETVTIDLGGGLTTDVEKEIEHELTLISQFPSQVLVSPTVEIEATFFVDSVVTSRYWDVDDNVGVFVIETLLPWPFEIETIGASFDNLLPTGSVNASISIIAAETVCGDVPGDLCLQKFTLVLDPTVPCSFEGTAVLSAVLSCRDDEEAGECAITTSISVPDVDATGLCTQLFVTDVAAITAAAACYKDDDYSTPATDPAPNNFLLGTTAYCEVELSTAAFVIDAVELNYAVSYQVDATTGAVAVGSGGIALDTTAASPPFVPGQPARIRFEIYLIAAAFPWVASEQSASVLLQFGINVEYDDGSRRLRSAYAGSLLPSAVISVAASDGSEPGQGANIDGAGSQSGGGTGGGPLSGMSTVAVAVVTAVLALACLVSAVVWYRFCRGASDRDRTEDKRRRAKWDDLENTYAWLCVWA